MTPFGRILSGIPEKDTALDKIKFGDNVLCEFQIIVIFHRSS